MVAPAITVIHAQNRLQKPKQVIRRQRLGDDLADDRDAPHAAADQHAKPGLPGAVMKQPQADVMPLHRRAVGLRACDRNLKLARQPVELRMQRRPLPNQLAPWPRVFDFIRGHAGQVVSGDVAHATAGSLNRVHADFRQRLQNRRHLVEFGPVELNVLARGEVTVAAVESARDRRQALQLAAV